MFDKQSRTGKDRFMKKSNTIISIGLISILILSTLVADASSIEVTATLSASPKTIALKEKMKIRRANMQEKMAKITNSDIEILKEKLRTARTDRKMRT